MRVLLDTNVLLRLHLQPAKIGERTKAALGASRQIHYSPLSFFELLQKEVVAPHVIEDLVVATHRIGIREWPLTAKAAVEARRFGSLRGRDPLDMLILAQASEAGMSFYTSDLELQGLDLDFVKDSTL